ncbi:MAG: hypothetical protein HYZ44_16895 [Bacteroidetes bacterium]|nr:hypothetical protein [Bacteroidota bacterium]
MAQMICGIVVDSLPKRIESSTLDQTKLKTKYVKGKIKNLSPKELSIAFKNGKTFIFLDGIFMKNISEDSGLTDLEKDLNDIFPNSNILIAVINDSVDFTGYSYLINGIKIRTKAVVKNQEFLDYGELSDIEHDMLKEIKQVFVEQPHRLSILKLVIGEVQGLALDKTYLRYRDTMFKRKNIEKEYFYLDGSSDQYFIEKYFSRIGDCNYIDLETFEWTIFQRRKLNFKKDSLKEFIYLAQG